jgi:hypothetical protein
LGETTQSLQREDNNAVSGERKGWRQLPPTDPLGFITAIILLLAALVGLVKDVLPVLIH